MQNAHRLFAALLIAAPALAACATTQPQSRLPDVKPDAKNVALGQAAFADGPIVQPVEVLEDSRCPEDVRCVHAGQMRLKMLWLRPGGRQQEFEVTLGQRTQLADGSILFERVIPGRTSANKGIKPADYRFDFRFDGGY